MHASEANLNLGTAQPELTSDETAESRLMRPAVAISSAIAKTSGNPIAIRPIQNSVELDAVYRMTHNAYVDMGFIDPKPDARLIHYPHLDALSETTILVATMNGEIVGTNSLTFDNPTGLHVDEDFKGETDCIRGEGRVLAASFRINTCKEVRQRNAIVMGLIGETVRLALSRGVETCLFIFHKRHERIYQRLLNMRTVAEKPEIACVRNFPAVFMRCDFEDLPDWCTQYAELKIA